MAKGFSFVLVTVVMIVMMVFGLLSLSTAGADFRLSQKNAQAQTIYYGLDSSGERLYAESEAAIDFAAVQADDFMVQKKYYNVLPVNFFSCLLPLVNQVKETPDTTGAAYAQLKRGVFFFYLESKLASIKGYGVSYKVDTAALATVIGGTNVKETVIASLYSTITSSINSRYTLNIFLQCPYGENTTPDFKVQKWAEAVNGNNIVEGSNNNLWSGK